MKILYVITGLGLGGAEKVVVDLANQMYELGHHVKIVYLTGSIIVRPKYAQIELHGLNLNRLKDLYRSSQAYRTIIKAFRPDIVHAHMVHANVFVRLNRIGLAIPKLICTAHNSNEGGRIRMMAYRFTNFLSDLNTNVSREACESLINRGAFNTRNLMTVYNGIDLNLYTDLKVDKALFIRELNLKPNIPILLAVGRLNQQKDYPNLLSAVKLLKDHYKVSDFHTLIAGEGDLRTQIEEQIHELNLEHHVTLLGRRNDVAALMSFADLFVLPSAYEGFGLVVAEAMACKTYVVATDSGGVKEVMGETGQLVPVQNSAAFAQAIYDALNLLSTQIEQNNHMARLRIEKLFSLESSVKQWLAYYESE